MKNLKQLAVFTRWKNSPWYLENVPASLEATDQAGYGSMSGSGGNNEAAQAAMGMPYTPEDGNASNLGFYEGVEDDHANFASQGRGFL